MTQQDLRSHVPLGASYLSDSARGGCSDGQAKVAQFGDASGDEDVAEFEITVD